MNEDYNEFGSEELLTGSLSKNEIVNFEALLSNEDVETVADKILESTYENIDPMKRDLFDKFFDYVYFKTQTGEYEILSMAYPTKRMRDKDLEKKIIEIINEHLYPESVIRMLKVFMRNVHDPDSNLYLAYLINSEQLIQALYNTFNQFKEDIFISDREKRVLNVQRIQQYSTRSDNRLSSPLDAAARLKYILEFLYIKERVSHIYTPEDLQLNNSNRD